MATLSYYTTTPDEEKSLKILVAIKEDGEGGNSYSEFKMKAKAHLDVLGQWKYIDGPDYKPPSIPPLVTTQQMTGVDANGNPATITIAGNEEAHAAALRSAESWIKGDKRTLAMLINSVPANRARLVGKSKSARELWFALREHYEPANDVLAIKIKQQICSSKCDNDPVEWREMMEELYSKLQELNPALMSDDEYARNLVTLMCNTGEWKHTHSELRDAMSVGTLNSVQFDSELVLRRLRREEIDQGMGAQVVQINNVVANRTCKSQANVLAATHQGAGGSKSRRRSANPPARNIAKPYLPRRPDGRLSVYCDNPTCESPGGHTKDRCFAFGGGQEGQYHLSNRYRGNLFVHLPPDKRLAARRDAAKAGKPLRAGERFAGMVDDTADSEDEVQAAMSTVEDEMATVFMVNVGVPPDDEEPTINAIAFTAQPDQVDRIHHDTGATRHIFNSRDAFEEFQKFDRPLGVNGFGTGQQTEAVGKGNVKLVSTVDGKQHTWTLTNALLVPSARCNLISCSQIDKRGVKTETGLGALRYFAPTSSGRYVPFAEGKVMNGLYALSAEVVKKVEARDSETDQWIAAMIPSTASMFGSADTPDAKRRGFTTVSLAI
ncbi:unnamed protein product [Mycena citricolor]|uniref:Retrovirus-related Pol polyprotein from transposon TNT 1-94-like beta-barrel domain-containing protein n=1 Tax=Mycena citricolor TaxID=2018698 RepID=A0AAD2HB90_9AGAR|nr:unnamed protein product [Mycena citricolor]